MVLQVSRARASPSLSSKLEALSCSPLPRSPPPPLAEAAAVAAVLTPALAFFAGLRFFRQLSTRPGPGDGAVPPTALSGRWLDFAGR